MHAAYEASACGLPSIVLDAPTWFLADARPEAEDLVRVGRQVQVLGIFEGREILWSQGETSGTFRADQILLATGASDRLIPFPGWTLPGVISHHEVRYRSMRDQIRSVRRAIVAGAGDGLISSAQVLINHGVEVVAILDAGWQTGRSERYPLVRFMEFPDLAKIPFFAHHAIFEARAEGRVTKVTFGQVDPQTWKPCEGPTRTEDVDLVVTGFGTLARNHLSVLAGCKQQYNAESGSWGPVRDLLARTSVPGIFALSYGGGEAGFHIDLHDGQIAAITAAEQAGVISAEAAAERRAGPLAQVARLKAHSRIQPGLLDLMRPDTVVCPCEEITLAEIHQAINDGARDMTSLKLRTRLGMGECQGRDCACAAAMIVGRATGQSPEEVGTINPRPPARPVTLGVLAKMESRLPVLDGEEA